MVITVYQVISVAIVNGHCDIIPDSFVYGTKEQAEEDIDMRLKFFGEEGEIAEYKGEIKSLLDIKNLYTENYRNSDKFLASFFEEKTEFYIYELGVIL